MIEIRTLLDTLNTAKSEALVIYTQHPEDENHLRYQSLHESTVLLTGIIAQAAKIQTFEDQILLPQSLLIAWTLAITRSRIDPNDDAFRTVEETIRSEAIKALSPEERAAAELPTRQLRLYGDALIPYDALIPFFEDPCEETLEALNGWIKAVGKFAVWEAWRLDKPSQVVTRHG